MTLDCTLRSGDQEFYKHFEFDYYTVKYVKTKRNFTVDLFKYGPYGSHKLVYCIAFRSYADVIRTISGFVK